MPIISALALASARGYGALEKVPPAPGSDPYYANVIFLATMHGTPGATAIPTDKGPAITNSGASLSSAQTKFGPTSLLLASGNTVTVPSASLSYNGDYTEEFYFYPSTLSGTPVSMDTYSGTTVGRQIDFSTTQSSYYYRGNASIVTNSPLTVNAWNHVAVTRSGTTITLWINGALAGSVTGVTGAITPGQSVMSLNYQQLTGPVDFCVGYMECVRITGGVARYTAPFTPPTTSFPTH
jgi:hypothetical protein